jgi:hypothetical protein
MSRLDHDRITPEAAIGKLVDKENLSKIAKSAYLMADAMVSARGDVKGLSTLESV